MTNELYKLPQLHDANGDTSKTWYIYYYVLSPITYKLVRIKITKCLNTGLASERQKVAAKLIAELTEKLISGYNPLSKNSTASLLSYSTGSPTLLQTRLDYYTTTYLAYLEPRVRKASMQHYQSKFKIFLAFCLQNKREHIHQWNTNTADLFVKSLTNSNRQPNTINDYITLLTSFFKFVKRFEDINNPFAAVQKFKKLNKPAARMQPQDVTRLFLYLEKHDPTLLLFCRFIFYCFIRPHSELRYAQVSWIDFERQNITVPAHIAKNSKEITLPIPRGKLLDSIMEYSECSTQLFVFTKSGKPGATCCSKNYWAKRFNVVKAELRLPKDITLYSLKHTGAILMHNAGASTKEIQLQMRHHSLDMTDKYLRQMQAVESDAIRNHAPNF